jgi:hypothetical protein
VLSIKYCNFLMHFMKTQLKKYLQTFSTIFATTLFILGLLSITIPKLANTQSVKASDNNTSYLNTANWQRTASIIPWNKGELATQEFKNAVDKAKNAGFNEISLHIQLFQSSLRDNEIYLAPHAPTDLELTNAITYINSTGLNVSLKFFVDVDYNKGSYWRAYIDPANREIWFKNYTTFVKKYAQIAEQYNVKTLSIGTELYYLAKDSTTYNTIGWNNLIKDIRNVYSGKLTYGYNHSGENDNGELKFIENLDFVGISGYYPVTNNPNATAAEIEANWDVIVKNNLDPIYNRYKKPIVFTELGYRSITSAGITPWDSNISGTLSVQTQANLYEGLIRSLSKVSYFQGWHLWDWGVTSNDGGLNDKAYTPQNKPAEKVLAKYYRFNGGEVPSNWEYVKPVVTSSSTSTTSSLSLTSTQSQTSSTSSPSSSSSSSVPVSSSSLATSSVPSVPVTSSSSTSSSSISLASVSSSTSSTATTISNTKPLEVSLVQDKLNPNKLILGIQNNQTKDYQNVVLDIEVYNQDGSKVDQVVRFNQRVANNTLSKYEFEYNPKVSGKYLIKLGFFDNNWKLIEWYNDLGTYNLESSKVSVTTTSTTSSSNIVVTNQTKSANSSVVSLSSQVKNSVSKTAVSVNSTNSVKSIKANTTVSTSTNETVVNLIKVVMGGWTGVALALKK